MAEIKNMLDDAIEKEITNFDLAESDEERDRALKALVQLHKLHVEESRLESESEAEVNKELDAKAQRKESRKDRIVRIIIAGVELIVPLIFYGAWMKEGFKFEENGSFTSSTFRNFWGRLKPGKR